MPRVSQREVLAERQDAAQPVLFDDRQLPVEPGALEAIRQRRYEHQGVRLVEDDAKALRLVELLSLKWGVKRISAEMNISPHTVRAARRLLVTQGKLAPYKQRVVEAMEDAIEAGVQHYRDAVENGNVSAAQIPVGMAILFDKRALAMGEPTSISGAAAAGSEGLKVEDINAYFEQLPTCKPVEIGGATDSKSTGNPPKAQQTGGSLPLDVTLDAGQPQPGQPNPGPGSVPGLAVHPAGRDATGTDTPPRAQEGGGGVAERPGDD